MKANCLMAHLFDIQSGELCDVAPEVLTVLDESNPPVESLKSLILEFWYKQIFTFYSVCCDLAEAGVHSIYC